MEVRGADTLTGVAGASRSQDSTEPVRTRNSGCGSGSGAPAHLRHIAGLRRRSFANRCSHSYCSWPRDTGMTTRRRYETSLRRSKEYPLAVASQYTDSRYDAIALSGAG